jgi:hypothetical protein
MSIDNLPTLYLAKMDVVPTHLRQFMDWYDHKHAPDNLRAGFYSAQSFHCRLGAPLLCNVYEIESSEVFYTDAYLRARTSASDPQRPEVVEHVTNISNTTYRQVLTKGVDLPDQPWRDGDRTGAVDAPVISVLRFDSDAADDEQLRAFIGEYFARISARDGFLRARLGEQHGRPHPARPPTEPRWAVLVEWAGLDEALAAGTTEQVEAELVGAPGNPREISYCVAQCVTTLRPLPSGS